MPPRPPISAVKRSGLRAVIVTPDYPPDHGGVAVSVQRIAGSLAREGVRVLVIVPRFSGYQGSKPVIEDDSTGHFHIAQISVNDPNVEASKSCAFAGFGGLPQAYFLIKALVQEWRPDVLHSFTLYPFPLHCAIIARELRLPFIVGVRGNDISANIFAPAAISYVKVALDNADVVAPVAAQLGDFCKVLRPAIEKKVLLVANGAKKIKATPKRVRDLGAKTVQFGTVCIQRPKKNLDVLVNAFIRLREKHKQAQLVIVGPIMAQEKRAIARLGLGRAITFTGKLKRPAALAAMAAFDAFVIPSAFDGCANAMLEAMSFGLPIIASKTGGALDFIEHGKNGLLFEPLDEDTLLEHLKKLLSDVERRRLSAYAKRPLRSPADEAQDWLMAYQRAIRQARKSG